MCNEQTRAISETLTGLSEFMFIIVCLENTSVSSRIILFASTPICLYDTLCGPIYFVNFFMHVKTLHQITGNSLFSIFSFHCHLLLDHWLSNRYLAQNSF